MQPKPYKIYGCLRPIIWKNLPVIGVDSTVSASTSNGASALSGKMAMPIELKLWIIIRE